MGYVFLENSLNTNLIIFVKCVNKYDQVECMCFNVIHECIVENEEFKVWVKMFDLIIKLWSINLHSFWTLGKDGIRIFGKFQNKNLII